MKTIILPLKLIFLFIFLNYGEVKSKGDLTRQKPISAEILMKGTIGESHFYEPSTLRFETGKLYKLTIKNISDSKHYFSSKEFSNSIFTRKIQVIKNNEKISEIKGLINEVEIFPHNSLEWWFVPVKTGRFNDLFCSVIDKQRKKKHSEMGMVGTIIIE